MLFPPLVFGPNKRRSKVYNTELPKVMMGLAVIKTLHSFCSLLINIVIAVLQHFFLFHPINLTLCSDVSMPIGDRKSIYAHQPEFY